MRLARQRVAILGTLALAAACGGGDDTVPTPSLGCGDATPVVLEPGAAAVVDPTGSDGCLLLPATATGAEHVVVAVATTGIQLGGGVAAAYRIDGTGGGGAPALRLADLRSPPASAPGRFHARLRAREARAALAPSRPSPRSLSLAVPPTIGDGRAFRVCADLDCAGFVTVPSVARYVGRHAAIFVDETVPAGGLSQAELDTLGTLFDTEIYALDTLAFGRESDIDGNGVVAILLSDAVNALSGGCDDGVVLGYFLGSDLLPAEPGSNGGEVFYSRVPDPGAPPACQHSRPAVLRELPRVFIHELQHMINYNQRVLVRGGTAEHVWLNEALSHFAEELGGRFIAGPGALGDATSRASQFQRVNVLNAFDYLADPGSWFLVVPGFSFGASPERGAGWLFVRWLADHYGDGSVASHALTRALVATTTSGAETVAATSGRPFAELVGMWQLANYLDNLEGVTPLDSRLEYRTVNLRTTFASLFPVYPLRPDSVTASFARDGVLRAGSGRHVRVAQPAGAGPVELRLSDPAGGPVNGRVAARWAVMRLR